jgi:Ca2+-binding RTX toxin-like protein
MAPIIGDLEDNILDGTTENDTILGLAGNDTLNGSEGNDILQGSFLRAIAFSVSQELGGSPSL